MLSDYNGVEDGSAKMINRNVASIYAGDALGLFIGNGYIAGIGAAPAVSGFAQVALRSLCIAKMTDKVIK